jgi:hypothetical protein
MTEILYYLEKWAKNILFFSFGGVKIPFFDFRPLVDLMFWWGENTVLGLSASGGFNVLARDDVRLNTDRWCVDN